MRDLLACCCCCCCFCFVFVLFFVRFLCALGGAFDGLGRGCGDDHGDVGGREGRLQWRVIMLVSDAVVARAKSAW
jgi:hypothetical protein